MKNARFRLMLAVLSLLTVSTFVVLPTSSKVTGPIPQESVSIHLTLGNPSAATGSTILLAQQPAARFATYCDNKCGDTQKCMYTCCTITTTTIGGIDFVTSVSCSSSLCCAHPLNRTLAAGSNVTLPLQIVEGVPGQIKWGLAGTAGLDASTIEVESNNKTKTVTLSGTVHSATQRSLAAAAATRQAKGYKVSNRLKILKQ